MKALGYISSNEKADQSSLQALDEDRRCSPQTTWQCQSAAHQACQSQWHQS